MIRRTLGTDRQAIERSGRMLSANKISDGINPMWMTVISYFLKARKHFEASPLLFIGEFGEFASKLRSKQRMLFNFLEQVRFYLGKSCCLCGRRRRMMIW